MLLTIAGAVLLALGLFAGTVLVTGPLGLTPPGQGPVLWLLFPTFSLLGYTLVAMGARAARIRGLSVAVSAALLLLALAAATTVVLAAAGLLRLTGGSGSLWFVATVAGGLGLLGAASFARPDPQQGG
jgi:hypothetical protein